MMLRVQKYVLLLLAGLFLFTIHSFSQVKVRGSVKGTLVDSTTGKQILSDATVSVTPLAADSSSGDFTVTDKVGAFLFKNLGAGTYRLLITFEGYLHISKNFTISATNKDIDFATLYMNRRDEMMQEVIVQRPPMSIKKDTVEYSAEMYTTKPNAVAEDLLKKFPGIQVDKNGGITAQGETVQRVLVNGKRFFSDDPKLATRNMPPDIIDKIQVFDDLSDQSKFTGFDDGNRVKTINIITKKDKRQGYFGRVVGGAGTSENYDESINMHRFDNDQQISLLGQANDINKQNFTPQDILGSSGGRRGGGGGGGGFGGGGGGSSSNSGVTTVTAGGVNYRNALNPKTDVYGSYFYNNQHVTVKTQDSTIKPIPNPDGIDTSNTNTGGQTSFTRNESHRIYLNLEERFDSSNSLIFRPNVTIQHSDPGSQSNSFTIDNHGSPVSRTIGQSTSANTGFNINNANLQLRHKFNKPFRTISLDLSGTANVNDGFGYNYSVNDFYKSNQTGTLQIDTLNQYYNDSLRSVTLSPTLSYTEPIAKNQILEFNYNHTYLKSTTINNTFDFVDSLNGYQSFDSLFSNSYKFLSNSDRFTLNYRIQNPKFNLSLGSGLQLTRFNSQNITKGITVAHDYTNFTPTMNFQYTFSKTQHFRMNYNGRTGTPSPAQLQPLTTTSDEINFQTGNPDLKPQFTHSLRMLYAAFDPGSQRVLFATINASTIVNDIQSKVYSNAKGGQVSSFVNLNGTYNISGYLNFGFPLKIPKSNLNFISNVNYSQSQTLNAVDSTDAAQNLFAHVYAKTTTMGETVSWTTNIKKNFDMNFSSASSYTINRKTGLPSKPGSTGSNGSEGNLNVFTQTFSAEITAYTNNGWLIATTLDYTYTDNNSPGYNASVPLLTPSIAKELFKKKNGELRLSVFDLLNQNTSVNKSVSPTLTSYTRTNVLTRYAMLTFTWNLNNFAGSNQRKMPGLFPGRIRGGGGGGRRGGGFGPGGD
jgi:uncharacterized membrane protein YgcG